MQATDIQLIRPDNPNYRAWVSRVRNADKKYEFPDPFASTYTHALHRWEKVVQFILSETIAQHPNCPERILSHLTPRKAGRWQRTYRELDYIAGTKDHPEIVVEIKLSERGDPNTGTRGWYQLGKTLNITQNIWPHLQAFCLNVAMGQVIGTQDKSLEQAATITDLPQLFTTAQQPTIWLNGNEVAQYAIDHKLLTTEEITGLATMRAEMLNPMQAINEHEQAPRSNWIDL